MSESKGRGEPIAQWFVGGSLLVVFILLCLWICTVLLGWIQGNIAGICA